MSYEKIMIHLYDAKKEQCLPEFLLYDVADIRNKKLFDGRTGLIEGNPGTGKGSVWNFCKVRFIRYVYLLDLPLRVTVRYAQTKLDNSFLTLKFPSRL